MFKKIEIWILYLFILISILATLFFGVLVRQGIEGRTSFGALSIKFLTDPIVFISRIAEQLLTQTLETKNFYPICYESLCSNPEYWSQLEELLKIEHCFEENFIESKKEILNIFDKGLLTKSINLYADLIKISLKKLSV